MVVPIIVLLFLSFLQGAWLPVNLVVIVIVCRSFIVEEKANYYLAFAFGLLLSLLLGHNLGTLSLTYLILVKLTHFIRKTEFASHWLVILPLLFISLIIDQLAQSNIFSYQINFGAIFPGMIFALPAYFIVRIWEERFIPKAGIRLKVGR
ncbi:MAG: hypothetical protein M1142_05235 [Patescibacteria group bacterium]|nr:hypothetical protein [Patescibacteria group bacterium]